MWIHTPMCIAWDFSGPKCRKFCGGAVGDAWAEYRHDVQRGQGRKEGGEGKGRRGSK